MLALLSTTFNITNCDFEDMADIKGKIEDGEWSQIVTLNEKQGQYLKIYDLSVMQFNKRYNNQLNTNDNEKETICNPDALGLCGHRQRQCTD